MPVWGLGAKTAHGETRFSNARLEPGVRAETTPRVTREQAAEAALARLGDTSARVTGARLMLLPREELRLRADAPASAAAHPNAAHYERVVTGFTLIYRVELSARDADSAWERPWVAQVDALSGQVLTLDLLAFEAGVTWPPPDTNAKFRTTQHAYLNCVRASLQPQAFAPMSWGG